MNRSASELCSPAQVTQVNSLVNSMSSSPIILSSPDSSSFLTAATETIEMASADFIYDFMASLLPREATMLNDDRLVPASSSRFAMSSSVPEPFSLITIGMERRV